jgi:hypothetical protein
MEAGGTVPETDKAADIEEQVRAWAAGLAAAELGWRLRLP